MSMMRVATEALEPTTVPSSLAGHSTPSMRMVKDRSCRFKNPATCQLAAAPSPRGQAKGLIVFNSNIMAPAVGDPQPSHHTAVNPRSSTSGELHPKPTVQRHLQRHEGLLIGSSPVSSARTSTHSMAGSPPGMSPMPPGHPTGGVDWSLAAQVTWWSYG